MHVYPLEEITECEPETALEKKPQERRREMNKGKKEEG
jgi:hypothetical protein